MEIILRKLGKQQIYQIGELSEVAAARRAGVALAKTLRFDEARSGQLALIITEAASNIAKHAKSGHLLMRAVSYADAEGIEIIALDAGPGMANVSLNLIDGHSSAGSYGIGLGAMRRLAHEFDIYTDLGKGTVLVMTLWNNPPDAAAPRWSVGAVCLPMPGEIECGDAWLALHWRKGLVMTVADGLGHGPEAAKASVQAVATLQANPDAGPGQILQRSHQAMQGTRGAAVAVACINLESGQLIFAGVGNIAGCIYERLNRKHLLSQNGIVGTNLRKVQEFQQNWSEEALLVLHSDGIGTRWDLDHYPGLQSRHPAIIAAVLYRDFCRGRDDATVLVVRKITDI